MSDQTYVSRTGRVQEGRPLDVLAADTNAPTDDTVQLPPASTTRNLRVLAEAANFDARWLSADGSMLGRLNRADAAYIAAASPDRILALLDEKAKLEAALTVERIAEALPTFAHADGTVKSARRFAQDLRAALLGESEEA